jgi:hypothetical protein
MKLPKTIRIHIEPRIWQLYKRMLRKARSGPGKDIAKYVEEKTNEKERV